MKILVDEMPLSKYDCPFSKESFIRRTKQYCEYLHYECSVTKEECDLECGACGGLKLVEM